MTRIGIIREGKTPPDKRVALTPKHCKTLVETYPDLEIVVQPSNIRAIPDSAYSDLGFEIKEDLSHCDILIGVKEVPFDMLLSDKTYLFFSHTYKKQPYNRELLQTILEKKIRLIDYEVLTKSSGRRLVGFGRYAGIVGAYNALLAVGKKYHIYELKPAHLCEDRTEVEEELRKVDLPQNFRITLTGNGRVAGGAIEILDQLAIKKVSAEEFLDPNLTGAAYTQLSVGDYNKKKHGSEFDVQEFYQHPDRFESNFMEFAPHTDLYIACHYWDAKAPFIFSREDAKSEKFAPKVVADISCDIDGPVASTLRPSTIADPLYGYNPKNESEVNFMDEDAIGVMAVDNLPCELPKDASEDFGDELVKNVIPELLKPESDIIRRATETNLQGELTPEFAYLKDYVEGKD